MTLFVGVKQTLATRLADDLGRAIVEGTLQPGAPLPPEDELLTRFGVSRTVLREALQMLGTKGMLETRQKRGTHIRPRSDWSQLDSTLLGWHASLPPDHPLLRQLMEVRRIIEPAAAALAAERGSDADLAQITASYERMANAGDDVDAFVLADLDFHTAILEASHNEFLLPIGHAIRTMLLTMLRLVNPVAEENRRISVPLHRAIMTAIVSRNGPEAAEAMRISLEDAEFRRVRDANRPRG